MTDLTKIEKPFGLLDFNEQVALKEHGGPYQVYRIRGWTKVDNPYWHADYTYRVAPGTQDVAPWDILPPEVEWVARDMSEKAFGYIQRPSIPDRWIGWSGTNFWRIDRLKGYVRGTVDWKDSLQRRPE